MNPQHASHNEGTPVLFWVPACVSPAIFPPPTFSYLTLQCPASWMQDRHHGLSLPTGLSEPLRCLSSFG